MKRGIVEAVGLCRKGLEFLAVELMPVKIGIASYGGRITTGVGVYLFDKISEHIPERKKYKKGIVADYLPWLLIGIAILAILMIAIFVMKEQGAGLIDKIKNLLR